MEKINNGNGAAHIDVQARLDCIARFLQGEYSEKKMELRERETTIEMMKAVLQKKEEELNAEKEALQQARDTAEGNRQLINKLLGEISKLQNDIEWYKRTYEQRSFLGTIKEKFRRKLRP